MKRKNQVMIVGNMTIALLDNVNHPLKAYAVKHGIKLKRIAADLGITQQHLYLNVFRGKHISAKLKARINEYLKTRGACERIEQN
jgi:hypothetical protein